MQSCRMPCSLGNPQLRSHGEANRELQRNGMGDWGRKGVANLAVSVCLLSLECPAVRKALQFGHHGYSQARHTDEIPCWRLIDHAVSVNTETGPRPFRPRRAQI